MKFCFNCGEKIEDDAAFCEFCGTRIESEEKKEKENPEIDVVDQNTLADNPTKKYPGIDWDSAKVQFDNTKEAVSSKVKDTISNIDTEAIKGGISEATSKAKQGIKIMADHVGDAVSKADEKKKAEEEEKKAAVVAALESAKQKRADGECEMWSWLKRDAKRQQFFTEEELALTEDEFMYYVEEKMTDNNVPAIIEKKKVYWDRSNVCKEAYLVTPLVYVANPLSYIVQFNKVGKFAFVEEKAFITPPDLPEVPGKKVNVPNLNTMMTWSAIIGLVFLFWGIKMAMTPYSGSSAGFGIFLGAVFLGVSYICWNKVKTATDHNKKVEIEELAWEKAWSEWSKTNFMHSFQEDINGQLSRVFDAVFSCIKQVSEEQLKVDLIMEDSEKSDLNELEQLIARRKEEYR